jgi:hypothetical protein
MAPTSSSSDPKRLVCPRCATAHPLTERFCPTCGMPLTYGAEREEPVTPARERARKVKPQLSEGPLVKVAGARHQAEAEFLQGLLLEEGIPSTTRRARGFDVPDFLAAGPRDIFVPASGAQVAHDVLLHADLGHALPGGEGDAPLRILAGVLLAVAIVALIAWLGTEVLA